TTVIFGRGAGVGGGGHLACCQGAKSGAGEHEMASGLIEALHDQGVSVVVVSGYALPPVSVDKAAAFLQKPFSGTELLTALRRGGANPDPLKDRSAASPESMSRTFWSAADPLGSMLEGRRPAR